MSKIQKEGCRVVSIYKLKEWKCLTHGYNGLITWTNNWTEKQNSISYSVSLNDPSDSHIRLEYTITDEKHHIDQKYPIIPTPCHYGGVRYWFICSIYHNGVYCGRRVAKLYMGGGGHYFACRHCYELTYASRVDGYTYTCPDLEEQESKIKRYLYRGKPTKKYRNLMRMEQSMNKSMLRVFGKLGKLL